MGKTTTALGGGHGGIGPKAREMADLKAKVARMLKQHLEPRIISQRLGLRPEKTSRLIRAVREEEKRP